MKSMGLFKKTKTLQKNNNPEIKWKKNEEGSLEEYEELLITEEEENFLLQIREAGIREFAVGVLGIQNTPTGDFLSFSRSCEETLQALLQDMPVYKVVAKIPIEKLITSIKVNVDKADIRTAVVKLYLLSFYKKNEKNQEH